MQQRHATCCLSPRRWHSWKHGGKHLRKGLETPTPPLSAARERSPVPEVVFGSRKEVRAFLPDSFCSKTPQCLEANADGENVSARDSPEGLRSISQDFEG